VAGALSLALCGRDDTDIVERLRRRIDELEEEAGRRIAEADPAEIEASLKALEGRVDAAELKAVRERVAALKSGRGLCHGCVLAQRNPPAPAPRNAPSHPR
jgi:hypothetical protein